MNANERDDDGRCQCGYLPESPDDSWAHTLFHEVQRLAAVEADRDRWKADADRLVDAALTLLEVEAAYDRNFPHEHPLEIARREMLAALAAPDALTAETGEPGAPA